MDAASLDTARTRAAAAWDEYIDVLAPFRPALHAYCRRLTGNIWDAEDLVQEAIVKGFGALGAASRPIDNPRAYITRIATNAWVDVVRRRAAEDRALAAAAAESAAAERVDGEEVRDAAATLIEDLAPRERAAVLMKDVLDFSLQEVADVLGTTANAVKAALYRGRTRLREPRGKRFTRLHPASAALVDRFIERLNAGDLPGLLALMLDGATIDMFPCVSEAGRQEFGAEGSWLWQAVHVHPERPADARPPKWMEERALVGDEQIMVAYLPLPDGKLVTSVTRLEEEDGHVASIRSYQFCPETVAEVAAALGMKAARLPYRGPSPR